MPADTTGYPPEFAALLDTYNQEVTALMARLEAGRVTTAGWGDEMRRLLARYSQAARMLGGNALELIPTEIIEIREWLHEQFGYLDGFEEVIQAAGGEYDQAWLPRAQMYGASTVTEYWEGRTSGLPLPAMPGQGTQCLSNCKCSWDIQWLNKEKGDADCYWKLHPAEHCQTCETRAEMWNPVRIRGGDLEDEISSTTAPTPIPGADIINKADVAQKWENSVTKNQATTARDAVSKVHTVPANMKKTKITGINKSKVREGVGGDYDETTNKIRIVEGTEHAGLNTAHEMGHWLDRRDLGHITKWSSDIKSKASEADKAFQQYHKVMEASPTWQRLNKMLQTKKLIRPNGISSTLSGSNEVYLTYALDNKEVFARAYAQYIATKSGNPMLLAELQKQIDAKSTFAQVWPHDEFMPIANALDKIFEANGILK